MKRNKILALMTVATMMIVTACGSQSGASTETASSDSATEIISTETATDTEEVVEEMETETEISDETTAEGLTFEDIGTDAVSLIAIGNSDVPVGQYSQEILENLGIWEQIQDKISFGSNVKEVLSQVEEGTVDCGIVYATDAATATGIVVSAAAPEGSLQTPVLYPAALLTEAPDKEAAAIFMDYVLTKEAAAEFEKVGFDVVADTLDSTVESDVTGSVMVFAAASMTEALTAIGDNFMAKYPNITVQFNFDSSGTLQTQIEEGAEADIFFSAAEKQMDALDNEGMVDSTTRVDLLKNEVVLIVPSEE